MYKFLKSIIFWINTVVFSIASLICITAVFFRYVLNDSITWAEEAVRFLFVFMFFFGATEAIRLRKHVAMDIFVEKLPGKFPSIMRVLDDVLVLIFLVFAAWLGFRNSMSNMGQLSAALKIPYGYVYLSIPLGCILMSIMTIYNIIDGSRELLGLPKIERE